MYPWKGLWLSFPYIGHHIKHSEPFAAILGQYFQQQIVHEKYSLRPFARGRFILKMRSKPWHYIQLPSIPIPVSIHLFSATEVHNSDWHEFSIHALEFSRHLERLEHPELLMHFAHSHRRCERLIYTYITAFCAPYSSKLLLSSTLLDMVRTALKLSLQAFHTFGSLFGIWDTRIGPSRINACYQENSTSSHQINKQSLEDIEGFRALQLLATLIHPKIGIWGRQNQKWVWRMLIIFRVEPDPW